MVLSCRSTKKIQTAISKKDTAIRIAVPGDKNYISNGKKNDTLLFIQNTLSQVDSNLIHFTTFSAKVNVDYRSGDGKNYNLNATLRMYRDSAIWVSANALLGIEAMRVLITKDSVKLLDKLNKTYTARSVSYLQDLTALPLDLHTLQDLIIGNPVFLDSNVISYSSGNKVISLLSIGRFFKNLITLDASDKTLMHSKLDDVNMIRSRTADLTYSDYNEKRGIPFSTKRRIVVAEKNRLDIRLDFRQFEFNGGVGFPFGIPRNYDRD
jgi:hypothetical protein